MNASIKSFKYRNEELMKMLDEVRTIGFNSPQAQSKFYEAKDMCLSLYEDEDRMMHPMLFDCAKNDPFLTQTITFFISEVDQCYRVIENFFYKYPGPCRGLDYANEFGAVFAAMQQRSRLELHTIQGIYLEHMQQQDDRLPRSA